MKNNKFAKISLVILTLALCFGTVLAISTMAGDATPTPVISQKNIEYGDRFSLMYAIPASTVTEGASVTLYVHEGAKPTPETYTAGVPYTVTADEIKPEGKPDVVPGSVGLDYPAYVFTTDGIGAKAFTTEFYVVAKDNSADGKWSEVVRYSVAEYLYERLATPGITAAQNQMYNGAIAFGNGAQLSVYPALDAEKDKDLLIENLCYVVVKGGNIAGFKTGVYPKGSTLDLKSDDGAIAKWKVETFDASGEMLSSQENLSSVTVTKVAKTVVTCGETIVINYRDDAFNFATDGTGYTSWTGGAGTSPTRTLVDLAGDVKHPKALEVKLNDGGLNSLVRFYPNYLGMDGTSEAAKSFEYSFDIKLKDLPSEGTTGSHYLRFRPLQGSSTRLFDINMHVKKGEDACDIWFENNNGGVNAGTTTFAGVKLTDWVNIRMVIYEGDSNLYIYVNGDNKNPYISTYCNTTLNFANLLTASSGDNRWTGGLQIGGLVKDTSFYIDNIFIGYTTDTNPTPYNPAAN